jgi:hypothetical protein
MGKRRNRGEFVVPPESSSRPAGFGGRRIPPQLSWRGSEHDAHSLPHTSSRCVPGPGPRPALRAPRRRAHTRRFTPVKWSLREHHFKSSQRKSFSLRPARGRPSNAPPPSLTRWMPYRGVARATQRSTGTEPKTTTPAGSATVSPSSAVCEQLHVCGKRRRWRCLCQCCW